MNLVRKRKQTLNMLKDMLRNYVLCRCSPGPRCGHITKFWPRGLGRHVLEDCHRYGLHGDLARCKYMPFSLLSSHRNTDVTEL